MFVTKLQSVPNGRYFLILTMLDHTKTIATPGHLGLAVLEHEEYLLVPVGGDGGDTHLATHRGPLTAGVATPLDLRAALLLPHSAHLLPPHSPLLASHGLTGLTGLVTAVRAVLQVLCDLDEGLLVRVAITVKKMKNE